MMFKLVLVSCLVAVYCITETRINELRSEIEDELKKLEDEHKRDLEHSTIQLTKKELDEKKLLEDSMLDDSLEDSLKVKKEKGDRTFIQSMLKNYEKDDAKRESVVEGECVDTSKSCHHMVHLCVPEYRKDLEPKCAKTCGWCDTIEVSDCKKDELPPGFCDILKKNRMCSKLHPKYAKVKKICFRTCGFCRVPSPPACASDPLGCCWDGVSFVSNGCPVCEDNPDNRNVCNTFSDDCDNDPEYSDAAKWMMKNCPDTCRLCRTDKCKDKQSARICEAWKVEGKCESKEIKTSFCPYTCNFCA